VAPIELGERICIATGEQVGVGHHCFDIRAGYTACDKRRPASGLTER
jgi:hypothetical protein